jgi:hypothetical protein
MTVSRLTPQGAARRSTCREHKPYAAEFRADAVRLVRKQAELHDSLAALHARRSSATRATELDNLVSLCRPHHRAVHEQGWRIHIADGIAVVEPPP